MVAVRGQLVLVTAWVMGTCRAHATARLACSASSQPNRRVVVSAFSSGGGGWIHHPGLPQDLN